MRTRILITIGDINGIGAEIIIKTLGNKLITQKYDITVLSPVSVIEYYCRKLKIKLKNKYNIIPVGTGTIDIKPGKITEESGYAAGTAIKTAVELCLKKEYDAVVTAPISKEALNLGGFNYDGHTEMLTDLGRAKETAMIMVHKKIKVGFASTHPPLKNVSKILSKDLLYRKIKVCYQSLKNDFNKSNPSIGILSLNPHAGEGGMIGDEEIKIIEPAIKNLKTTFKDAKFTGPYPSDSYFANRTYQNFDLTFAMYHDQGFIPFKMIAGIYGVNYTAGLSFVRTSPDHGTAFDIAGKNMASEVSLIEAIKTGDRIVRTRRLTA